MTTSRNDQLENLAAQRWRETLEALEDVAEGRVIDGDLVHAWLRTWGTENESAPPQDFSYRQHSTLA